MQTFFSLQMYEFFINSHVLPSNRKEFSFVSHFTKMTMTEMTLENKIRTKQSLALFKNWISKHPYIKFDGDGKTIIGT